MNDKLTEAQIEARIIEMAQELSGIENIYIDTPLLYLGLRAVNFWSGVRQEFGVELRPENQPSTLSGIVEDIMTDLKFRECSRNENVY
jgi:hypothetical protein